MPERIVFGVTNCDLSAMDVFDHVFLHGVAEDNYWAERGFDINIAETQEGVLLEDGSKQGAGLLGSISQLLEEAGPELLTAVQKQRERHYEQMAKECASRGLKPGTGLRAVVEGLFDAGLWADFAVDCGACAQVCPSKCIEVIDDLESLPPRRMLVQHFDACIMCGQCERCCPTGQGIRMSTDWDTAGFKPEDFEERVEKELVLCEVCGEVLAPAAQRAWLADRLGPAAFANPSLSMFAAIELGYTEEGVKNPGEQVLRQGRMAMRCPKSRRHTAWAV